MLLPIKSCKVLFVVAMTVLATACGSAEEGEEVGETDEAITVKSSFVSRGTAYYPANSRLEGGFLDRKGAKLRTLQQYLAGQADYVSVAMDTKAFAYGQRLRIRELEKKYGRSIVFRVVDTGGAFRGKGRTRIDICVKNKSASLDPVINGRLNIDVIDERAAPPPSDDGANDTGSGSAGTGTSDEADTTPAPADPAAPAPADDGDAAGGQSCSSDGMCNPGNDGSGLICVSGRCVPGCKTNAQCPGVKTCQAGQCR